MLGNNIGNNVYIKEYSVQNIILALIVLILAMTIIIIVLDPFQFIQKGPIRNNEINQQDVLRDEIIIKRKYRKDLYSSILSISWSPDGNKIAIGSTSNVLYVLSPSDGRILWHTGNLGAWIRSVDWNPEGTKIVVGLGDYTSLALGRVIVLSFRNGLLWASQFFNGSIYSVDWSPKGDKIAVSGAIGRLVVYSNQGELLWYSEQLGSEVWSLSWNSRGNLLAAGTKDGRVIVYDKNGKIVWEKSIGDWIFSIKWLHNDSKIIAGGALKKLVILNASNGEIIWTSPELEGWIRAIALSPDETKVAVAMGTVHENNTETGSWTILNILNEGEKNPILHEERFSSQRVLAIDWSPKNDLIVIGTSWFSGNWNGLLIFYSILNK